MNYMKLVLILVVIVASIVPVMGTDQDAENRPGYFGLPNEGLPPARTIGDSVSNQMALSLNALAITGIGPSQFKDMEICTMFALDALRQRYSGDSRKELYYAGEILKVEARAVERSSG